VSFTIRPATHADADSLPDIERSASTVYLALPDLAWIASAEVTSAEKHRTLINNGMIWVSVNSSDAPVGFLSAEQVGGTLHVAELSVRREVQGLGIGRALIAEAARWAREKNLSALTLTTFRNVPWTQPFYHRLGFRTVEADKLSPEVANIMEAEEKSGLRREHRCAMLYPLS
jgi:GNAT superfamily N-acetyltransferase